VQAVLLTPQLPLRRMMNQLQQCGWCVHGSGIHAASTQCERQQHLQTAQQGWPEGNPVDDNKLTVLVEVWLTCGCSALHTSTFLFVVLLYAVHVLVWQGVLQQLFGKLKAWNSLKCCSGGNL
jgi:hypothetical protein